MQNTTQNSSWNSFICRASLQDPQREASWVVYVALHIDDRVLAGVCVRVIHAPKRILNSRQQHEAKGSTSNGT